jgi:hypothetical protein
MFMIVHISRLLGTVSRDFLLQVFYESAPKPLKIMLGTFGIFFKNSRRYLQVKVCHWYINDTSGRFATGTGGVVDTLAPAVNLLPVSTTPVAKIMETMSDCLHLKVNFEEKISLFLYLYVNSTTKRCPNKIIKTFLIEDFFHLPPVVDLELGISPRIFENI